MAYGCQTPSAQRRSDQNQNLFSIVQFQAYPNNAPGHRYGVCLHQPASLSLGSTDVAAEI